MESAYNKILVCLESGDSQVHLFAAAQTVARLTRAQEIIFAQVYNAAHVPPALAARYEALNPPPETLRKRLEEKAAEARIPESPAMRCVALVGNPLADLLKLAVDEDVDLIVAGRPEGPPRANLLARRLAFKCHCSILTIPAGSALRLDSALVPIRDSECSQRALQTAIDMASLTVEKPEIIAHYVYSVSSGYTRMGLDCEAFVTALKDYAQDEYAALAKAVETRGARLRLVVTDDPLERPEEMILEKAEKEDVGAIFVGSRGRTGAAGVILGHVTESLITSSRRPVFAVKKKGENIDLLKALGIII